MLAYNLMSLFRQAVLRGSVQHTLSTLHHKVFAVGAFWQKDPDKRQQNLAVSQRRRDWFEGLCANAGKFWNDDTLLRRISNGQCGINRKDRLSDIVTCTLDRVSAARPNTTIIFAPPILQANSMLPKMSSLGHL